MVTLHPPLPSSVIPLDVVTLHPTLPSPVIPFPVNFCVAWWPRGLGDGHWPQVWDLPKNPTTWTILKRGKVQWYGHLSPSSGLAKTILQGTVKGGRRHGRQRKRWDDNIREWTGLEFGRSQRAVENREKWTKLVAK